MFTEKFETRINMVNGTLTLEGKCAICGGPYEKRFQLEPGDRIPDWTDWRHIDGVGTVCDKHQIEFRRTLVIDGKPVAEKTLVHQQGALRAHDEKPSPVATPETSANT
jgi:hypothetical protein